LSVRPFVRPVSKVPLDPVEFWLSRLDWDSQRSYRSYLNRFLIWLRHQPGWGFVSPRDILVRQLQSEDPYEMLDLLQKHVGGLRARKASKRKIYTVVKSFFAHNRCALPSDPSFRIHSDVPPVVPRLSVENILEAYMAANLCYKSAIMVKWQAFLDSSRLVYVSQHLAEQVVSQIQQGVHPVRIDLPGRKSKENEGQFFSFIGRDAVDALVKYFEEDRGWPKAKDPIWLIRDRKPLSKLAFEMAWMRIMRRVGRVPKKQGPIGSRYGYNAHEMRDVAMSLCHTQVKKLGFDMDSAKFWAGQVGQVDPLKYDKFYEDSTYMRDQYLIAENCLNILSQKPTASPEQQKEIQTLRDEVRSLKQFEVDMRRELAEALDKIAKI